MAFIGFLYLILIFVLSILQCWILSFVYNDNVKWVILFCTAFFLIFIFFSNSVRYLFSLVSEVGTALTDQVEEILMTLLERDIVLCFMAVRVPLLLYQAIHVRTLRPTCRVI